MTTDLSATARLVRQDLRTQRPWIAVFDNPSGATVLEYRTPRRMRGGNALFAERPQLLLWRPGAPRRILADVDLGVDEPTVIEPALEMVAVAGRDHAGEECALFDMLLALVRAHYLGLDRRHRARAVGEEITSVGVPSLDAWASCLSLADLQAALLAGA